MGTPVNFYKKFKFVVEIDGVARAGFTTCSDMRIVAETVSHREGGRLHAHKSPGLVEFPPITLTRGKSKDFDLYNWMKDTVDAAAGTGLVTPDLYRQVEIVQQDRAGNEVERWACIDCWCKEYGGGDWDNNASEVGMEEVVFEADYWERVEAA
jgi:phage tail-like protein